MSRGNQLDTWRVNGVVGWAAEQEEEEATLVWRVKWPCDQRVDLTRRRVVETVSEGLERGRTYRDKEELWTELRAENSQRGTLRCVSRFIARLMEF